MIDWKSGKSKRVCRCSLSVECHAMAGSIDALNFIRFFWEILVGHSIVETRNDQDRELATAPEVACITDCK
eukprot:9697683-Lingulodinium_polyedra.AAC.1